MEPDQLEQPVIIKPLELIHQSRFEVYKAIQEYSGQIYIMKLFPLNEQLQSPYFEAERSIQDISHENIVKLVGSINQKSTYFKGEATNCGITIMEYAPNGDFSDKLPLIYKQQSDKLIRTYFHQLISGIECLHSYDLAHLDLKLENLVLDEDYQLKIADFDHITQIGEEMLEGRGTEGFRSPELKANCQNAFQYQKSDIYSMGVILFNFAFGIMPYLEDKPLDGYELEELMQNNSQKFWLAHQNAKRIPKDLDKLLQSLIEEMTIGDPELRISIPEIKHHRWFKGPTYTKDELSILMNNIHMLNQ